MPHYYDKAPPAFAKDPWAWDYTRDRLEGNTGIPYDQWEGKHFAGAAAMYKNVVKKYGASVQGGIVTMPKECIDCGQTNQHYQDDYICVSCRDQIEAAPTYAEAEKTISNPGALSAIRESLYESLGHAAKDAKKGRKINAPMPSPLAGKMIDPSEVPDLLEPTPQVPTPLAAQAVAVATGKVSRNYSKMLPEKLVRSINELEKGEGEAMGKVKPGEDAMDHLEHALRVAQERGIAV